MVLRWLVKVLVVLGISAVAFMGGYLTGLFDQEGAVAWREASYATSALRALRAGKTDAAILLLETRLDTHLVEHSLNDKGLGLARKLRPYPEKAMRERIGYAAQYRIAYPSPAETPEARAQIDILAQRYK
jgi:hypothetical protein